MLPTLLVCSLALLFVSALPANNNKLDEDDVIEIPGIGRYFYNEVKMNWTDAYAECKRRDGHLVVLESAAEAAAIREVLISKGLTYVHAGYHDHFSEGNYQTLKGQKLDQLAYHKWSEGFPVNSDAYNCGGLRRTGIQDSICSSIEVFICELPIPADYTHLPGYGYFKRVGSLATWPEAHASCASEGAHLIIPRSEEMVLAILAKFGSGSYWSGMTRQFGTDVFVTVFDEPIDTTGYNKWSGGKPNPNPAAIYIELYWNNGFFANTINTELPYICQITYP